jgi:hypothetical protein
MAFRPFTPADGPAWLPRFADSVADLFRRIMPAPLRLWPVATAELPEAAAFSGGIVYDSDDDAVKLSDGSAWTALSEAGHTHTEADIQLGATDRLVGRDTAGAGAAEEISVGGGLEFTGSGGIGIANDGVTNARLTNMAQSRVKGRSAGAGTGDPEDLSAAQVLTLLGLSSALDTYTPTVTAGSGAFTTVSATGRYKQVGKLVFVYILIEITTNGTAATYVQATLPVASASVGSFNRQVLVGQEHQSTGLACIGNIANNSSNCQIRLYDFTYPGGTGRKISVQGVYEAA